MRRARSATISSFLRGIRRSRSSLREDLAVPSASTGAARRCAASTTIETASTVNVASQPTQPVAQYRSLPLANDVPYLTRSISDTKAEKAGKVGRDAWRSPQNRR